MSGMGEKARTVVTGVGEKVSGNDGEEGSVVDTVGEKVSGLGEKIKGTVKGVSKPESEDTDDLSIKIDAYLDEKSDQIIEDWELATKNDLTDVENKYTKVSQDLTTLDNKINEHREDTDQKIRSIEERLEKLEKP